MFMKTPSRQATLLFLIEDDKILLAMKKRGFGKGRWNGVGGKPEGNELIEETAIRECFEEINVTPVISNQVACLNFFFPTDKTDWNQQVIVYFCTKWQGDPIETEEMKPKWFKIQDIPYDDMWKDDKYWLPEVINGNFVEADFIFDDNDNVKEQNVVIKLMNEL